MFKNLLRELDVLKNTTSVSIPIEADSEGYYDKECPAQNCQFVFKVHGDDWENVVRDEEVFCPACRHVAPATNWYTREQLSQAEEYALRHLQSRIDDAMRRDASEWNRRQPRNALIKMTMEVDGSAKPVLLPVRAAEPMRLRTSCEKCGCRYSYIGAAFFCPACGANSVHRTFRQTLSAMRAAAGSGDVLRKTVNADQAEVLKRALFEKGVQDAVMCFQRLCEEIYLSLSGLSGIRRNAFQNLNEGSEIWRRATGRSFEELIAPSEMQKLRIYFQQRHLLAHRQGIVDDEYISRSGDTAYAVGQRLVISEATVLEFADLIERLGQALSESTQ